MSCTMKSFKDEFLLNDPLKMVHRSTEHRTVIVQ